MKELTKAEEEVMNILWKLNGGFVKDIVEEFPEPKPAYNTVSTIVRILENKGWVKHEAFGRTHKYIPTVSKEQYLKGSLNRMVKNYFGGSFEQLVSFFAGNNNFSTEDIDELLKNIKKDLPKNN
ncbi:MAG: BlaI/MecI/CopY family transcriptional regulator [Flavobacteriales bacterium]|nr:BlaI/MecI/CopY family transcriptional regulator [Flavobacteriales bacterium]